MADSITLYESEDRNGRTRLVRREDWLRSSTGDMIWAARKTVLDLMAWMNGTLDVLDPLGCRRRNEDRDGNPLHEDESMGVCELIDEWERKLGRVNSILYDLSDRARAAERELEELRGQAADG